MITKFLATHMELKAEGEALEDPELKTIVEEAWNDFKKGLLDYETYKTLVSGTLQGGGEFLKNMINFKFTKEISNEVAEKLTDWWKQSLWIGDSHLPLQMEEI